MSFHDASCKWGCLCIKQFLTAMKSHRTISVPVAEVIINKRIYQQGCDRAYEQPFGHNSLPFQTVYHKPKSSSTDNLDVLIGATQVWYSSAHKD